MSFPRVSTFKTPLQFQQRLDELKLDLPFDETLNTGQSAPLEQPLTSLCGQIGNRWCVLPMEGWDGTPDGRPTELTVRRWQNFGRSGAKLIWGGEAVAVRPDGRANPNQLMINPTTVRDLEALRITLEQSHQVHIGGTNDLLIGLQLTHSGDSRGLPAQSNWNLESLTAIPSLMQSLASQVMTHCFRTMTSNV